MNGRTPECEEQGWKPSIDAYDWQDNPSYHWLTFNYSNSTSVQRCVWALRTGAAVAERLLAGAERGQRADGQRGRAGRRLQVLAEGRQSPGLRVDAVRTGQVLGPGRERALPVGDLDGHLAPEVKAWEARRGFIHV